MTFTAEEHTSLTMTEHLPGYGMLCTEATILCNSEKFDCVGAVIMTSNEQATTLYTKYACSGSVIFTEGEHTTTTYNEGYY